MARLKKHSIYFLSLLFLAMQGVGTLHFYLYHQDIPLLHENEGGSTISSVEPHQCDFIFYKTPLSLLHFEFISHTQNIFPYVDKSFCYNEIEITKFKQSKYLRGPPETLLS